MSNQKSRSLDDVLDYYLISSEERGVGTLTEMIELYPQYERDLRELSAFRKLQESIPDRTYTNEEETALKDRGGRYRAKYTPEEPIQNAKKEPCQC